MNNVNWYTLILALLGACKLILEPFGIVITDENINAIANGIAALATVIGVIMSHKKPEVKPDEKYKGSSDSAV